MVLFYNKKEKLFDDMRNKKPVTHHFKTIDTIKYKADSLNVINDGKLSKYHTL